MSEWISVKDRLPEKSAPVLICANGHRVTAYYDKVKEVFRLTEDENMHYLTDCVTHWTYLPEPPEREDDAEWVNNKCSACGKGIENLIDSREWYENEKPNYCPFCGTRFITEG